MTSERLHCTTSVLFYKFKSRPDDLIVVTAVVGHGLQVVADLLPTSCGSLFRLIASFANRAVGNYSDMRVISFLTSQLLIAIGSIHTSGIFEGAPQLQ